MADPIDVVTDPAPDIRRWLPAVYLLALCLCVAPLLQTLGSLWPPHFDEATWRYGAVGIFLSAVGAAPLGLLIALGAAVPLGHRVILRTVGVLAIILTLLVLIVCGAFALDVLQVRSIVRPEVRGGFDLGAAKAVFMALVVMVTSILIAIASFRTASPEPRRRTRRNGADLIVAQAEGPLE
jgi:hypothetical protein